MTYQISLTVSIAIFALFAVIAITVSLLRKGGRFLRPLNVLILGVFLAGVALYIPMHGQEDYGVMEVIMNTIHDVFQLFTVDSSFDAVGNNLSAIPEKIRSIYTLWFSILYGLTPFLTFGFILSLFKNLDAHIRYLTHFHYDVYAFSDLNERSLALAEDIQKTLLEQEPNFFKRALLHLKSIFDFSKEEILAATGKPKPFNRRHCKGITVFCGVDEDEDEKNALIDRARKIGAIIFEKDIMSVRLKRHSKRKNIFIYMMYENESQNVDSAIGMYSDHGKYTNVHFCVFSDSAESELLLNHADVADPRTRKEKRCRKKVDAFLDAKIAQAKTKAREKAVAKFEKSKSSYTEADLLAAEKRAEKDVIDIYKENTQASMKRVNVVRSLVNHTLYETGIHLFDDYPYAARSANGDKIISAVVIGMGLHGTEMVKALAWYGQMVGYELHINAFDKEEKAESLFAAKCPELMSKKYNNLPLEKARVEDSYHINVSSIDIYTDEFVKLLATLPPVTYVMVCLGDDERNLEQAVRMRMLCARLGWKPFIQAIRYNTGENEDFRNATNFKGDSYDIDLVGDMKSVYSDRVVMRSELEKKALARHMKWDREACFWKHEYNYLSSIASAMHYALKCQLKLPEIDVEPTKRSDANREMYRRLEHRRWNAYMRAEGYVFAEKRNDLAKQHPCLVFFDDLSEDEKRKDDD